MGSCQFTAGKISTWKSTVIFNYLGNSNINAVGDSKNVLPELKNDGRMHVSLSGNHFQQNKVIIPNNNNAINIYCVYKIDPIAFTRDDAFTFKMLYLVLWKLLKMLTLQNTSTKDMVCVLTKMECLVREILITEESINFLVLTKVL